ncbi:hypothetical protein FSP39_002750 [Pinctada imbricata]|uniref:Apple domain-containing protein n=1 Tax=Pinctada imbricata TaxID=66713 RepID=A0AA88Y9R2_PINIB|nr:hypothetical protein FSP39_002750 [Pinctada imbricata]
MLITAMSISAMTISVAMAGGFNDKIFEGNNLDSMVFGQQLINAIITKENDISFMECIQQCVNYKRCKSVNYLRSFLQCELNYEEELSEEIFFISNSNVIFSRIKEWKKVR